MHLDEIGPSGIRPNGDRQLVLRHPFPADVMENDGGQHNILARLGMKLKHGAGDPVGDQRVLIVAAHVEIGPGAIPEGSVALTHFSWIEAQGHVSASS